MCLMLVNFTNQWRSISSPNRLIWLFIISCREEAFDLRTKETYSAQCDSIEQAPTDVEKRSSNHLWHKQKKYTLPVANIRHHEAAATRHNAYCVGRNSSV